MQKYKNNGKRKNIVNFIIIKYDKISNFARKL